MCRPGLMVGLSVIGGARDERTTTSMQRFLSVCGYSRSLYPNPRRCLLRYLLSPSPSLSFSPPAICLLLLFFLLLFLLLLLHSSWSNLQHEIAPSTLLVRSLSSSHGKTHPIASSRLRSPLPKHIKRTKVCTYLISRPLGPFHENLPLMNIRFTNQADFDPLEGFLLEIGVFL